MNPSAEVRVLGVGTALPGGILDQETFARFATRLSARIPREEALLHTLARQSGIAQRRSVLLPEAPCEGIAFFEQQDHIPTTAERMEVFEREAPALAEAAARRALEAANLSPTSVTHVVAVSCTGFFSPGLDFALMERLGLAPGTERLLVGYMGCHGALNATGQAAHVAASDPAAKVLVVSVELCTLHFQHGMDRNAIVPNTLFGDGAAAWIVAGTETPTANGSRRIRASRSRHLGTETADRMTWRITDTGFRMTLKADVPDLIADHLPGFAKEVLAEAGLSLGEIECWAVHPGGPRVLEAVQRALRIAPRLMEPSRAVFREVGNVSSATVPFIWEALASSHAQGPMVSLAFGPGLVAEMTVMD